MLSDDKRAAALIVGRINAKPSEAEAPESEGGDAILACASDLLAGVAAKDARRVAEALRSAFMVLGSEPREEPYE